MAVVVKSPVPTPGAPPPKRPSLFKRILAFFLGLVARFDAFVDSLLG